MYRPSAVVLAQTIGDLPVLAVQVIIFTIIVYFMTGLQSDPGLFFAFLLFTYLTTLCTTAFFRFVGYAFGTFNDASKVSGFMFSVLVTVSLRHHTVRVHRSTLNYTVQYAGYVIYVPSMKPWFSWIRWIDPIYYSFEALMINELDGLDMQCSPPQLFPLSGEGPQGCAITGAEPGVTSLSGAAWANQALDFYKSHVWRNFGIVLSLWVFFLALCMFVIERLPAAGSNRAILLFKRGGGGRFIQTANKRGTGPRDEEEGNDPSRVTEESTGQTSRKVKDTELHADRTSVSHSILLLLPECACSP